jgi:triacylglycerol lipase
MNNFINIPKDSSGNVRLEPDVATLLGDASLAAYTDYANSHNPNYTPPPLQYGGTSFNFLQRFTGFDDVVWGDGEEERYGLIYQWSARSDIYLFAFRGTSSVYDMVLDLESGETTTFRPYSNANNFPSNISVGDGFYKIYATKSHTMPASMQTQLFAAIKNLPTPANEIVVTGHSLGCTMASLFTLDIAVSLPNIAIANINFASPRVGTANWQNVYNETYNLQNKTIRIRNSYDLVPKLPPKKWPFDFKDIGEVFPVSFGLKNYHIDFPAIILAWHALENYRYVVNRATRNSPQIWMGEFPDQAHLTWPMLSYNPYTSSSEIEQSETREEAERAVEKKVDEAISA